MFPIENGEPQEPAAGFDSDGGSALQSGYAAAELEKRRYPRISVSIPSYCCNIDSDGTPLDLQIGVIKEIGQEGLAIELFSSPASEVVSVSFIGDGNQDIQIRCRVAHSKANSAGKVRLGLYMLGSPGEIHNFVTQAVRAHHQSCLGQRIQGEREDI